jgi:SAM-dependent methyltransferase
VSDRSATVIAEGLAADTAGWDFGRFAGRMVVTAPPWDYHALVEDIVGPDTSALLDMGTGGGEWMAGWLSGRPTRPAMTVATECWPPNVPVAAGRLKPFGVTVVRAEGAADNIDQGPDDRSGRLPFRSGRFDVVINRHESYRPAEIARVLRPGGMFLTQQVATGGRDLHELLGLPLPDPGCWSLRYAVDQAAAGGLTVLDGAVGEELTVFHDAAPLLWYLRQVPWTVPGFDPSRDLNRIRAAQRHIDQHGPVQIRRPHFWFRATRRPD